jgi:hypothetical protein
MCCMELMHRTQHAPCSVQIGEVEHAVVMMDHHSKRSRGFGFVSFTDEAAVEHTIRMGSRPVIFGKVVEVKRAVPREQLQSDAQSGRRRAVSQFSPGMQPAPYPFPFAAAPHANPAYHAYSQRGMPTHYAQAERDVHPALPYQLDHVRQAGHQAEWQYALHSSALSDSAVADEIPQWHDAHGGTTGQSMLSPSAMSVPMHRPLQHGGLGRGAHAGSGVHLGLAGDCLAPVGHIDRMTAMVEGMPHDKSLDRDRAGGALDTFAASLSGALPLQGPPFPVNW